MPQELVIALIAAGAALGGGLLGSFLSRSVEHNQWLRNEKYVVYKHVYRSLEEYKKDLVGDAVLRNKKYANFDSPESLDFELVSSRSVHEACISVRAALLLVFAAIYIENSEVDEIDHLVEAVGPQQSRLKEAMRNDLRSGPLRTSIRS